MPRTHKVGAGESEVQNRRVILGNIVSLRVTGDTGDRVWWGERAKVKFPYHEGPESVTDPSW